MSNEPSDDMGAAWGTVEFPSDGAGAAGNSGSLDSMFKILPNHVIPRTMRFAVFEEWGGAKLFPNLHALLTVKYDRTPPLPH